MKLSENERQYLAAVCFTDEPEGIGEQLADIAHALGELNVDKWRGRIRFAPERADVTGLRCPSTRRQDTDLIGCGSANVSGPDEEGLCDCHDCGLFFRPEAVNV